MEMGLQFASKRIQNSVGAVFEGGHVCQIDSVVVEFQSDYFELRTYSRGTFD